MKRWATGTVILVLSAIICAFSLQPVQAAESKKLSTTPATLTLQVEIEQPEVFWNYNFLTRDSDFSKPSMVRVEWSTGDLSGKTKQETLVFTNKTSAKLSIPTERGALINLNVSVVGAKNLKLGTIGLQVLNSGQTETVTITPPEIVEPNFTWGG